MKMNWLRFPWHNYASVLLSFLLLSFSGSVEIGYPLEPQSDCFDPILRVVGNEAQYMNASQYIDFVNEVTNNYFRDVTQNDELPSPLASTFNRTSQLCPLIFGCNTSVECDETRIWVSGINGNPTNSEKLNLYYLCAGTMSDFAKATASHYSLSPSTSFSLSVVPTRVPMYLEPSVMNMTAGPSQAKSSTPSTSSPSKAMSLNSTPIADLPVSTSPAEDTGPDNSSTLSMSPSSVFMVSNRTPSIRFRGDADSSMNPSANPTTNPSKINSHETKFRLAFNRGTNMNKDSFLDNKDGRLKFIEKAYRIFVKNMEDELNGRTAILVGKSKNRITDSEVLRHLVESKVELEKTALEHIIRIGTSLFLGFHGSYIIYHY